MELNLRVLKLCCFLALASSLASADDLTLFEQQSQSLTQELESQSRLIATTTDRLERLTDKIAQLKKEGRKNTSFLQSYRLEATLKEAKQLSDQVDLLRAQKQKIEAALRNARRGWVDALDHQMEVKRRIVTLSSSTKDERKAAALEIEKLSQKRVQLATSLEEPLPERTANLTTRTASNLEDIQDRLNVIQDFRRRLEKEVSEIGSELEQMKKQKFARAELSHLLDEESFFGEQGFVRGGVNRTARQDTLHTNALSKPSNSADSSSVASQPAEGQNSSTTGDTATTASASQPASATVPTTNVTSSAAPTDAASSANTTSASTPQIHLTPGSTESLSLAADLQEHVQRDPLAQLASELGLPSKDIQDLSARRATDSLDGRIDWLERRRMASLNILRKLEELQRSLEQPHSKK